MEGSGKGLFGLRHRLVDDYGSYVSSFIRIKDERVGEEVRNSLGEGLLWPDPLIQLNPSFEAGEKIDELVAKGTLHKECARIFRRKRVLHDPGEDLRLHRHQADAIKTARAGHNYVLTTGTGSGKSLAYIVPVVDHVLRRGPGRGIQAIVVYPMNALANSQYGELEKFLNFGYPDGKGPLTFARYTGQESDEERQRMQDPHTWEGADIIPPGYEGWIPLSRRSLLIAGNEELSGRYIRFDEVEVHTTNVMIAAQCERFFMGGDEAELTRVAGELPKAIDTGWMLPGRVDLSRHQAPRPDGSP